MLVAGTLVLKAHLFPSGPIGRPPGVAIPSQPMSMQAAGSKGRPEAPIGIIGFSDFECPFCSKFAREVMPALETDYIDSGKVRFTFRHLPLAMHKAAIPAATAAECAGQQGAFWEMHDGLFASDGIKLSTGRIIEISETLKIRAKECQECFKGSTPTRITQDQRLARELGVASTPVFFVGRVLPSGELKVSTAIPGAASLSRFASIIDSLLVDDRFAARFRSFFGMPQF